MDANGVVTTYEWHPRGWLAALTVAGASTRFRYDGVGGAGGGAMPVTRAGHRWRTQVVGLIFTHT
jgi:YD repeat-containing protein